MTRRIFARNPWIFLSNYLTSSLASPPNVITWVEAIKSEVHRKCLFFLFFCFLLFGWVEITIGKFTSVVAAKCRICTNSFAINIDILLTLSRLDCPPLNFTFFSPLWGHPYVDEESKSHRHKNNCADFVCIKAKATLHGFMPCFWYVILDVGFRVRLV